MIQEKKKYKVASKVVLGFFLFFILVVIVSAVTYFSTRNLLETVENLSEPNEKLRQLNGLLAVMYLLDMSKTERTSDKDSAFAATEERLKERLDWLKRHAEDSTERKSFENISMDLSELMIVYAGLEEVRYNLTRRTFSEEALQNIERRIKRQQELSEMQFLGRVRNRDFLSEINIPDRKNSQIQSKEPQNQLIEIVKEIQSKQSDSESNTENKETTDAALQALKTYMTKVYEDEQKLQQNFLSLEDRLINKNKEVFSAIQKLISSMQRELLADYRAKNDFAYELAYTVSIILGVMIFLGIIGSIGFVNSILTEIRKGNEYRLKLEEAKKKSDDLARAKQDFLANMSHEIRNPIHAIQGYQESLNKKSLSPDQREDVNMIGFASDTLIGIVNDILDFSKLEAGKIKIEKHPFDPKLLFRNIKQFFSLKAKEKDLLFEWVIDLPEDKWINGDQLRISQILNNLISNAIKFTQEGYVKVNINVKEDTTLIMKVVDSGMGMSKEFMENVFQEFNQGDTSITRQYGGTGLGLAITKRLIDLQSGHISLESELGKGTEITVSLPVELNQKIEQVDQTISISNIDLSGLIILLVDDDAIGLKLLRKLLESKGAQIIAFEGGLNLKRNFDFDTGIDLAILDIQMPKVSGVEVLKLLKEYPTYKNVPFLAMTANVFVEEQEKLLANGFSDLLLKPFKEEEVLNKVASLLENNLKLKRVAQTTDKGEAKEIGNKNVYKLDDIMKFCMGDEEMLQEVMMDIIDHTKRDMKRINQAYSDKNYSQIREISHQLSSRLKQIKVSAGDLAKKIEVSIKSGDYAPIPSQIHELNQHMEVVIEALSNDFKIDVSSS